MCIMENYRLNDRIQPVVPKWHQFNLNEHEDTFYGNLKTLIFPEKSDLGRLSKSFLDTSEKIRLQL